MMAIGFAACSSSVSAQLRYPLTSEVGCLNARDAEFKLQHPLIQADLDYGELQLARMLADRPRMAALVKRGDCIWNFAARYYGGQFTGMRYAWANTPDLDASKTATASHNYSLETKSGTITVADQDRDGRDIPAEMLWSNLLFELLNTRNDRDFETLWLAAINQEISRDEFIRKYTKLEYVTLLELWIVYTNGWKQHAQKMGIASNQDYWGGKVPSTFEYWYHSMRKSHPDYFNYYESTYDRAIAIRDFLFKKARS
jgi:hypothetical protein